MFVLATITTIDNQTGGRQTFGAVRYPPVLHAFYFKYTLNIITAVIKAKETHDKGFAKFKVLPIPNDFGTIRFKSCLLK